jgi:Ca2+-binding RTX toxin-like protein
MISEYDAQYWSVMAYRDYVGDELKPSLDGFDHQHEYLGCGICGSLNHSVLDSSSQMETKNGDAIYPYTPMFFDIYASLYLYAYNKDTGVYEIPENNPGDDTYTISGPVNFTIYDTDGTDTLDFTILDLNSEINLDAPLSFIGTDEINYDDGEFYTGYIVSIFFYNDMENVNAGGGRDTITCNIAVNTINCGPGPDTVNAISSGDIIYGEVGNDTFVISDFSFNLIDGGAGIDRLDLTNQAADGSDIDLAVFDDSQIRDVEEISLLDDNISTLIKLTKDSILNFNSSRASDQDGDGDVDNLFYVLGDSKQDFVSLLSAEGWTYFKTENSYDWYQSSDGDVYFATTSEMGVYEISNTSQITVDNLSLSENIVNAKIGSVVISDFNQLSQNSTLNYVLSGEDSDKFEIDASGNLILKTGTVADFETKNTYQISISVLGVSKNIEVTVIDSAENTITGSNGSENLIGTDVDDAFDSGGGDDVIDGKGGNDTVLIFDNRDNYDITTLEGITKIEAKSSANQLYSFGTISLTNTENVLFSDTAIALDTVLNNATYFYGSNSSQNLTGTDGDDVFDSGGGDDVIDGKGGNDTVLIFDNRDNYEITTLEGITKIEAKSSANQPYSFDTISLTNVEFIIFSDQTLNVSDLTSQGWPSGKPLDSNLDSNDENADDGEVDDNTLSDVDLWANEFDANSISLPETVTSEAINETIDLEGFLGFESDSLALDFDAFSEDSVVADVQPVKIVPAVTYHAAMEYHENSSIDDLVYSSELG